MRDRAIVEHRSDHRFPFSEQKLRRQLDRAASGHWKSFHRDLMPIAHQLVR
jgi:hypothetical protein